MMALVSDYTRGRLLRCFTALGPYIREQQCLEGQYFFDCLAVCVNAGVAPEKREFFGWWLILTPQETGFVSEYHTGVFDKKGLWQKKNLSDNGIRDAVSKTLTDFYPRLQAVLQELGLSLTPSPESPPPGKQPD
ncbi:sigma factor-binding protein Crl [Morganella morganii]|nr:sigma factor-binding protein Crl [Morganella morganii]